MTSRYLLRTALPRYLTRNFSDAINPNSSVPEPGSLAATVNADVPGLSSAVVLPANQPVGPGVDPNKSGAYKVPEYFCYNENSYYEAEVEMAKYRLPQPSALKK